MACSVLRTRSCRKLAGRRQVPCRVREHVADGHTERLHGSDRHQCDQYHQQCVFGKVLAFLLIPQSLDKCHLRNLLSVGVDKDKESELLCRRAKQGCGFTESSLRRLGCSQLTQNEIRSGGLVLTESTQIAARPPEIGRA